MVSGAVAAYALSPIDLIPDFIPVIGYIDDLVMVPLGILLAIRLAPKDLGLAAIATIWFICAGWLIWVFWPKATH